MSPEVAYVYVIGAAGTSALKIGWGVDPPKRLGELQVGSPLPLTLLWMRHHPCAQQVEAALHVEFREYRLHGEWFDLGPDGLAAACQTCELVIGRLGGAVPVVAGNVVKLRRPEDEATRLQVIADVAEVIEHVFPDREFIGTLAIARELRLIDRAVYRGRNDMGIAKLISRSLPARAVQQRADGKAVRGYRAAEIAAARQGIA